MYTCTFRHWETIYILAQFIMDSWITDWESHIGFAFFIGFRKKYLRSCIWYYYNSVESEMRKSATIINDSETTCTRVNQTGNENFQSPTDANFMHLQTDYVWDSV